MMAVRKGTALILALVGLAVAAPAAQATFHDMGIREVGQGGLGTADYVELQMYASGQNFVGSHSAKIQSYNDTGGILSTFTFTSDVANGGNQRTIYVARNDGTPPGTPDVITPDLIVPTDGAVCYGQTFGAGQALDCVAFGTFGGFVGGIPSPTGPNAPAPPPGQALLRSIAPGCPTLFEASDDTNNSLADFAIAAQNPRSNAASPTETQCTGGGGGGATTDDNPPQTTITDGPKKRSFKRRISIAFQSSEQGSHFKCRIDGGAFAGCQSPFRDRVKRGKHSFEVFAIDQAGNEDRSPARVEFKVKKRRKR
jgi:hypothetical protein